MEFKNIHLWG